MALATSYGIAKGWPLAPGQPLPLIPPLTITGTPPTTGTVGQPYSFTPTVTGGAGTRVYTLASGALLAGLTLSPTTGAITGTPTAAGTMDDLSVRVTDDTGTAATVPTDVVIAAGSTGGTWGGPGTWGGGGTWGGTTPTPQPTQAFAFGARTGTPGESTDPVQRFTFGTRTGTPAEGDEAMQRFTFGTANTTPSE